MKQFKFHLLVCTDHARIHFSNESFYWTIAPILVMHLKKIGEESPDTREPLGWVITNILLNYRFVL